MSLIENVAQKFSEIPEVEAVALSGSRAAEAFDEKSDFDLYVYTPAEIPLQIRRRLAEEVADRIEINNQFWEPGDEWIEAHSGSGVDIMYRQPQWLEEQIERVLVKHQASVGYSTCFWHNLLTSKILFDRHGWLAELQQRARQPYPEPLRRGIIAKNFPILRRNISSYLHQIESAVARHDLVSVPHRTAALLASYFDICSW
jgi:predicted nucleotidyltransferase